MADKEVYFYLYCKDCKHEKRDEGDDPCNDCLAAPSNEDSHKPLYFKKKD